MSEYLESVEFIVDFFNKDRRAFDSLYLVYFEKLHTFSSTITEDDLESEIIASKCILQLIDATNRFSRETTTFKNIRSYLFVSVRNASRDYFKSLKGRGRRATTPIEHEHTSNSNIEHAIIKAEVNATLYAALKKLPEERRRVLELLYCEGHTYRETAEILNVSIDTVKNYRRAGQIQIRSFIKKEALVPFITLATIWCLKCYLHIRR
jgi:RNA polymerase sigma factor (sigma-70 family)